MWAKLRTLSAGLSNTTIPQTNEINIVRRTLRDLNEVYGPTSAADFGPRQLKAVRQWWIDRDLSKGVINHLCGSLKRVFKWGV